MFSWTPPHYRYYKALKPPTPEKFLLFRFSRNDSVFLPPIAFAVIFRVVIKHKNEFMQA